MKKGGDAARELFKENLNYYMQLSGVTQNDIVTNLKVSSATASDWVNGIKYPRVDAMQALSEMLNVKMSDLMSERKLQPYTTEKDFAAMHQQLLNQPGMRILFDRGKELTSSQMDAVLRVVDEILKDRDNDDL